MVQKKLKAITWTKLPLEAAAKCCVLFLDMGTPKSQFFSRRGLSLVLPLPHKPGAATMEGSLLLKGHCETFSLYHYISHTLYTHVNILNG